MTHSIPNVPTHPHWWRAIAHPSNPILRGYDDRGFQIAVINDSSKAEHGYSHTAHVSDVPNGGWLGHFHSYDEAYQWIVGIFGEPASTEVWVEMAAPPTEKLTALEEVIALSNIRRDERDEARTEAAAERKARWLETSKGSYKNFVLEHPFSWETEALG